MDRSRAATSASPFANPLPALYDRMAAVRRLRSRRPGPGCVAFTTRAQFSKGFPPNVVMLDALLADLATARGAADAPPQEQLAAAWTKLRQEAAG